MGRGEGVESAEPGVGGMRLILWPPSSLTLLSADGVLAPSGVGLGLGLGLGLRLELGLGLVVAWDSEWGTIVLADEGCSGSEKLDESGDEMGDEDGGDLIALADDAEKFRECENELVRSGELVSLPIGVPR